MSSEDFSVTIHIDVSSREPFRGPHENKFALPSTTNRVGRGAYRSFCTTTFTSIHILRFDAAAGPLPNSALELHIVSSPLLPDSTSQAAPTYHSAHRLSRTLSLRHARTMRLSTCLLVMFGMILVSHARSMPSGGTSLESHGAGLGKVCESPIAHYLDKCKGGGGRSGGSSGGGGSRSSGSSSRGIASFELPSLDRRITPFFRHRYRR